MSVDTILWPELRDADHIPWNESVCVFPEKSRAIPPVIESVDGLPVYRLGGRGKVDPAYQDSGYTIEEMGLGVGTKLWRNDGAHVATITDRIKLHKTGQSVPLDRERPALDQLFELLHGDYRNYVAVQQNS